MSMREPDEVIGEDDSEENEVEDDKSVPPAPHGTGQKRIVAGKHNVIGLLR